MAPISSEGDLGIRGLHGPRAGDRTALGRRARPVGHAGLSGQLLGVEAVGEWIRILRVGRPRQLDFEAGQYIRLGYRGTRMRKFSIASAPGDGELEFCVGLNPSGTVTPALFTLRPGAGLELGDSARGSFTLDPSATHHLMVATTTGIGPIRSMLRAAHQSGTRATFTVLHGASRASDLPYRGDLEQFASVHPGVTYVPTVSRPDDPANSGWAGEVGRVDSLAERMLDQVAGSGVCAYACGNGQMVEKVRRRAEAAGLPVRTESFD